MFRSKSVHMIVATLLALVTPLTLCAAPSACCSSALCMCVPGDGPVCCEANHHGGPSCCRAKSVESHASAESSAVHCCQSHCDAATHESPNADCTCLNEGIPVPSQRDVTTSFSLIDVSTLTAADVAAFVLPVRLPVYRLEDRSRARPTDLSLCVLNCVWRE